MITIILSIFVLGYMAIALEHNIKIDKSAPSLIVGVLCWTVYILMADKQAHTIVHELYEYLGEISGILFFLLGAMTIVELIDAHQGFEDITQFITTQKRIKLLWMVCMLTFFLSAALDNLTTTIVMVSILRKLLKDRQTRMFFVCMVVIAANAGGAWSPIGDVTTTMLWIGGQITAESIITKLILPSLACIFAPLMVITFAYRKKLYSYPNERGNTDNLNNDFDHQEPVSVAERRIVLFAGLACLIFVPFFKSVTHLPPFMGILLGLGALWLLTEIMHKSKNTEQKHPLSVMGVLKRVDVPSVLFFFGILVAISSLQATGILKEMALLLDHHIGNIYTIALSLGLLSAVVDNVPLVAATMGMYELTLFPTDHIMWELIAYCSGTGGSALIIGSAAGVAAMGMEKIPFGWYLREVSWLALIGYFTGAVIFITLFAY
ncbi:sodium:proton antiporter NhaD [Limibacter armeniacum]|uniref:sodium:proton antiporter NhaD n=1 Tax=Limibacter armeniacum TaxID=466084 RepID=UPI002FE5E5C4